MEYTFTEHILETKEEFDNLVFMGPPLIWKRFPKRHEFLLDICHKPLKCVVKKVMLYEGRKFTDPTDYFRTLLSIKPIDETTPWFHRHMMLSQKFNRLLMAPLWVRNLTCHDHDHPDHFNERKHYPNGSFYVEDGNGRALVYAIHLACGMEYEPVKVIHGTTWDGIFDWGSHRPEALEHNGILQR